MPAAIDFLRCILRLPTPWIMWVALLMAANGIVPFFFISTPEAQITLAAIALGAMIQMTLYSRVGFVRLLGVGHAPWLFLVPWLWLRLDAVPADGMFTSWMLAVIVLNSVSLLIDIADVARYAMGDRAAQITLS
ncbi:MAG: hypothetical protein BMS9Abin29_1770 [Gemmatimonadota bacterium]|nr:MAG: hypothetical protein BMS9Abin29_1770 [Gemmatimonadota bacterium]